MFSFCAFYYWCLVCYSFDLETLRNLNLLGKILLTKTMIIRRISVRSIAISIGISVRTFIILKSQERSKKCMPRPEYPLNFHINEFSFTCRSSWIWPQKSVKLQSSLKNSCYSFLHIVASSQTITFSQGQQQNYPQLISISYLLNPRSSSKSPDSRTAINQPN